MNNEFFERPILNSPYEYPARHWELDENGQPTQKIIQARRRAEFITPIPKPKKRKNAAQQVIVFDEPFANLDYSGVQQVLREMLKGVIRRVLSGLCSTIKLANGSPTIRQTSSGRQGLGLAERQGQFNATI